MRQKTRWILFEATKLVLVAAVFTIIVSKTTDAEYAAVAGTSQLDRFASVSGHRIAELEEAGEMSLEQIVAARAALDQMEDDLEVQWARLETHQLSFSELLRSQTSEMQSTFRRDLERIEGSQQLEALRVTERVADLETQIRRSPLEMKRRMIYPVIQLRGNGTVGSGVVISSKKEGASGKATTYVLTAFHVVQEITEGLSDPSAIADVKFMNPENDRLMPIVGGARVVAFQPEIDIAMIRMDLEAPWPYVAKLASVEDTESVEIFDAVYAVGCPLGNKPLPTVGEISSQEKIVAGETFWMVNAPTFFGNSGGGVFLCDSGRLIGISSMIYTYGKSTPMVVPHMGLFVPLDAVRSWLSQEGYAALCEPGIAEIRTASGPTADGGVKD